MSNLTRREKDELNELFGWLKEAQDPFYIKWKKKITLLLHTLKFRLFAVSQT